MVCIPIPCRLWGSRIVSALLGRCREHYQVAAGGWFGTSRYDGSGAEFGAENQEDQIRGRRQEN